MNNLKKLLIEEGSSIVRYANMSDIPRNIRYNLDFGISIAVGLNSEILKTIQNGPTQLYQEEYIRVNRLLDNLGKLAVAYIEKKGYKAYHIPSTISTRENILLNLSTLLPHKTVATRAGIGWIGKSALLVTKEYGSAIRLTSVLTNMQLETNKSVDCSFCGECQECTLLCPGKAILGGNWYRGIKREQIYDAHKCRDTIKLMIKKVRIVDLICGQCIVACPFTKRYMNFHEIS